MTPAELNPNSFGPTLTPEVLGKLNSYTAELEPGILSEEEAARRKTAEMMALPENAFSASIVVLCSVWPERLESQPFAHNGMGRKIYTIPAAKIDPSTRKITPSYAAIQNAWAFVMARGGGSMGEEEKPNWSPTPIPAASIARDIVQKVAGDFAANAHGKIGVGIVKGEITNGEFRATDAEIAQLLADQTAMLKYMVERADAMWDGNQRERIGRSHRKALEVLGLDETQHPWYRSRVQAFASCPRCAEPVKAEAMGCKHCSVDFLKWFADNPEEYKAGVFAKVDTIMRRKQVASQPLPPPLAQKGKG